MFGGNAARAQVVINEIGYDDAGTDNLEFVEFYNAGASPIDISGWQFTPRDPTALNLDVTIPVSTSIPAGGYCVIGHAAVASVNQVITGDFLENDIESAEIRDSAGTLIDAVMYETNKGITGNLIANGLPAETGPGWFGNNGTTPDLASSPTMTLGRFVKAATPTTTVAISACGQARRARRTIQGS
jgi:hypothetical protein